MTDSSVHVVATIPIDPAKAAEAAPALAALAAASRTDEGCVAYEVYESGATPGLFITVEEWTSQAHLDAHLGQPHVATAFDVAGPLLTGEVAIHPLRAL